MENQITAEQQERQEAARKLIKILETSPLDEALQLTCALLAYMLWTSKIEPGGERWEAFFPAFMLHVADQVTALGSVPSPRVH